MYETCTRWNGKVKYASHLESMSLSLILLSWDQSGQLASNNPLINTLDHGCQAITKRCILLLWIILSLVIIFSIIFSIVMLPLEGRQLCVARDLGQK